MRRQRELWKLLLFLLGVTIALGWGGYLIVLAGTGDVATANERAGVSSFVLAALLAVPQLWSWWAPSRSSSAGGVDPGEALALAIANESKRSEEQQGISDRLILPLRWHNAVEGSDRWENVRNVPLGDHSEPLRLDDTLDHIRDTYRRIPSRRLIILGKGGSGQTVLANRLVRALLEHRDSGDPIPVLFRLNTWDVTVTSLQDWLVDQLLHNHDGLDQLAADGKTLARSLIDNGRILPVLDGFDEITGKHDATAQDARVRHTALSKLPGADTPMVLTSRPDQFYQAIHRNGDVVRSAAAIELGDLDFDDVRHYLTRTTRRNPTRDSAGTGWEEVFHRMRDQPEQPATEHLRRVLTTPLMVSLARKIYSLRRDPTELLDIGRFHSPRQLEDHFLDELIPAAYGQDDSRWTHRQAQRWHIFLAHHLTRLDTYDLAWWQLGATLHRHTRVLTTMTVFTLAFGLPFALVTLLLDVSGAGLEAPLFEVLMVVLGFGLALGSTVGLVNETNFRRTTIAKEPERLRLRLRNIKRIGQPVDATRLAAEFTTGLVVGLAIGLALGLTVGIGDALGRGFTTARFAETLARGLSVGPPYGLAYGIVNVVLQTLGTNHDPEDPAAPGKRLSTGRTVALVRALAGGLTIWLTIWLTNLTTNLFTDGSSLLELPLFGLVFGLPFTLAHLASSAWGNWLVMARLWLPLTRRLPWRPKRFLEDAYDRGVLRQAGPTYQFRHARLRNHLHEQHRPGRASAPLTHESSDRRSSLGR